MGTVEAELVGSNVVEIWLTLVSKRLIVGIQQQGIGIDIVQLTVGLCLIVRLSTLVTYQYILVIEVQIVSSMSNASSLVLLVSLGIQRSPAQPVGSREYLIKVTALMVVETKVDE